LLACGADEHPSPGGRPQGAAHMRYIYMHVCTCICKCVGEWRFDQVVAPWSLCSCTLPPCRSPDDCHGPDRGQASKQAL
jgi:hypothetical protein